MHHGAKKYPSLHRKFRVPTENTNRSEDAKTATEALVPSLVAYSRDMNIVRLRNRTRTYIDTLLAHGRLIGEAVHVDSSKWTLDIVRGPNISDKNTLMTLGRAAINAYVPGESGGEWENVEGGFNYTEDFGWESDGLRGHVFADQYNLTVILGLKGTSTAVFDGAETTTNDKENDNLFFGCCCGQDFSYWARQVCACRTSAYTCNNTCVSTALRESNRYYTAAQNLYDNVTALYPEAQIWLIGHSLGGATSSLLGMTVGTPVVTFEAPGEAMAASRLRLPVPPKYHLGSSSSEAKMATFHFGHTADPLFMGTCNDPKWGCALAGYAMESQCHTGMTCIYDTVKDKGWGLHLINHGIKTVVHQVIDGYNETAECKPAEECFDCPLWDFYESNSSLPTSLPTTISSSYTRTRTVTCQTPGWFGCLDESTTSTLTSSTSSTTTCKTPGWFGCLDQTTSAGSPITTTMIMTTTTTTVTKTATKTTTKIATTTATCHTPGWWGCKDNAG